MKKTKKILDSLIEELERTPLAQAACDKVGISRNTFYRWIKEDQNLLVRVNEAISLGTGLVNDVAVSNVLTGIKNKDPMYTKFWLERKHPDFRKPYVFKIDPDDILQYTKTLNEKEQLQKIETKTKESSGRASEEEIQKRTEASLRFQAKWFPKPKKE